MCGVFLVIFSLFLFGEGGAFFPPEKHEEQNGHVTNIWPYELMLIFQKQENVSFVLPKLN